MATSKDTIELFLNTLDKPGRFRARAMFGEYALYADNKVVGLICNDLLYVKILPASAELEEVSEQDSPYPGAKAHYVVDEQMLAEVENLSEILLEVAKALPEKKKKKSKAKKE